QTQGQDIRNHIGQRAHIEVIDHGDGFVQLDEIRFSDGSKPADKPNPVTGGVAGSFQTQSEFCDVLAKNLVGPKPNPGFVSWVIENKLLNLTSDAKHEVGNQFVSIGSNKTTVQHLVDLRAQILSIAKQTPRPVFAHAISDGSPEDEFVFIRGNPKTPGEKVERRFLSAISKRPLNPENGSGRLLLAHKITAPNNPLARRVIVNRIWHHIFGRGIVESVDDFGKLGKKPTHPELLDYLANEFSSMNWSIKSLIKRLVMTRTYQMSSVNNPDAKEIDPDNQLLHRFNIKRLQGEAIRDSILSISGRLDPKMYGVPVPVHLTPFMSGRGRPGKSGPLDGAGRRSVYISVKRNFLSPMMLAFDTPIPFNTIGRRNQSNVPAQALIMMNDPFVVDQAKVWADQLIHTELNSAERINHVYQKAVGRPPTTEEANAALEFVDRQANELGLDHDQVLKSVEIWKDICHVVFNLKEFIFLK
ncbi:MAG: DUF1553 domain-containing protein, partial [Planctomycetota bacterium]